MFLREVGYSEMTADQIMYSHAPVLLLTMNYVITLSKWLCVMKKFIINKSTDAYKAGFKLLLYFAYFVFVQKHKTRSIKRKPMMGKTLGKLKSAREPEFLFSQNE